ncbi:hypothetical protein BDN70DRAFT_381157 [Pholiota conissans]|uniref:Uncharacterized protein n=1 Tax=Pholiota conissans TaxID=109636 RepID=A0A9P6CWG3_9AGAR|nr:hypothetical protein BDN70DRAFT_381157 [Pholiota conissans]
MDLHPPPLPHSSIPSTSSVQRLRIQSHVPLPPATAHSSPSSPMRAYMMGRLRPQPTYSSSDKKVPSLSLFVAGHRNGRRVLHTLLYTLSLHLVSNSLPSIRYIWDRNSTVCGPLSLSSLPPSLSKSPPMIRPRLFTTIVYISASPFASSRSRPPNRHCEHSQSVKARHFPFTPRRLPR